METITQQHIAQLKQANVIKIWNDSRAYFTSKNKDLDSINELLGLDAGFNADYDLIAFCGNSYIKKNAYIDLEDGKLKGYDYAKTDQPLFIKALNDTFKSLT